MDDNENQDIDALHAKHLIQTFVILYDKWEARPPESQIELKQLMKTFRQNCDNYGF